jgi:hypothetical protein
MDREHFWFVDDDQRVRWAVRVSTGLLTPDGQGAADPRIVFTSREVQISTVYSLEKDEQDLTGYEVLELLGQAKMNAGSGWRARGLGREAA